MKSGVNIFRLYENFKEYTEGVRVLFLLHRNKEGGGNNEHSKIRKIITTNTDEFLEALTELEDLKNESKLPLRIYSTVNPRNMEKAIRKFKEMQLESDYQDEKSRYGFYFDVKNRLISALMRPSSKADSNFLIDLDNCCERSLKTICKKLEKKTEILMTYNTKSGYHVITKPFDYTKLDDDRIQVNPDGLLLLDY